VRLTLVKRSLPGCDSSGRLAPEIASSPDHSKRSGFAPRPRARIARLAMETGSRRFSACRTTRLRRLGSQPSANVGAACPGAPLETTNNKMATCEPQLGAHTGRGDVDPDGRSNNSLITVGSRRRVAGRTPGPSHRAERSAAACYGNPKSESRRGRLQDRWRHRGCWHGL